jgi:hypothetical protein
MKGESTKFLSQDSIIDIKKKKKKGGTREEGHSVTNRSNIFIHPQSWNESNE